MSKKKMKIKSHKTIFVFAKKTSVLCRHIFTKYMVQYKPAGVRLADVGIVIGLINCDKMFLQSLQGFLFCLIDYEVI